MLFRSDIVDVNRFKKIPYAKKTTFYKKIFSKSEIDYCLRYKDAYRHFAAKFAIKEAVIKSITIRIAMKSILTSHNSKKPVIITRRSLPYHFLVSVSHEKDYAIAIVISQPIKYIN